MHHTINGGLRSTCFRLLPTFLTAFFTAEDQSNKMANTVDRNKQLRKSYNPVNVASVRRFDEARAIGAKKLEAAEQRATESVTIACLVTLFKTGAEAGTV